MVDSVSGGQRVQPSAPYQPSSAQEAEQKAPVARGYDGEITFSARTGAPLVQTYEQATGRTRERATTQPGLPPPRTTMSRIDDGSGDQQGQSIQQHVSQMVVELKEGFESIRNHAPELYTPQLDIQKQLLEYKIINIEAASESDTDTLHAALKGIGTAAENGELTTDSLRQRLQQLTAHLNSPTIFKDGQPYIQVNQLDTSMGADQDPGAPDVDMYSVYVPPTEAATSEQVDENDLQEEPSPATARSEEIVTDMAQDVGLIEETPGVAAATMVEGDMPEMAMSSAMDEVVEGLDLARTGMNQAELMTYLQDLRAEGSRQESIKDAIAALEQGDPSLGWEVYTTRMEAEGRAPVFAVPTATTDYAGADTSEPSSEAAGTVQPARTSAQTQIDYGIPQATADGARPDSAPDTRNQPESSLLKKWREFRSFTEQMLAVQQQAVDLQDSTQLQESLMMRGRFA